MKYVNSILLLVACSASSYACGMSDAPKAPQRRPVFTFREGQITQTIMLEPGRYYRLGDNGFVSYPLENNLGTRERNVALKRKPFSGIANTRASKKSEGAKKNPAHEIGKEQQLRAIEEIKMQPTQELAERKLLKVCNAQSKKRRPVVKLPTCPEDVAEQDYEYEAYAALMMIKR